MPNTNDRELGPTGRRILLLLSSIMFLVFWGDSLISEKPLLLTTHDFVLLPIIFNRSGIERF